MFNSFYFLRENTNVNRLVGAIFQAYLRYKAIREFSMWKRGCSLEDMNQHPQRDQSWPGSSVFNP